MDRNIFLTILLFCIIFINSCGSEVGGGAQYFSTVIVTVSTDTTILDSDIATWKDTNGDNICDSYTVSSNNVSVTIDSLELSTSPNLIPSGVRIENVSIEYTPADKVTPQLGKEYLALGQSIPPGGSITLDIMVMSQKQKQSSPLNKLISGTDMYKYYVRLIFNGVEVLTGEKHSFSTDLTMQVADFITDAETCNF